MKLHELYEMLHWCRACGNQDLVQIYQDLIGQRIVAIGSVP